MVNPALTTTFLPKMFMPLALRLPETIYNDLFALVAIFVVFGDVVVDAAEFSVTKQLILFNLSKLSRRSQYHQDQR